MPPGQVLLGDNSGCPGHGGGSARPHPIPVLIPVPTPAGYCAVNAVCVLLCWLRQPQLHVPLFFASKVLFPVMLCVLMPARMVPGQSALLCGPHFGNP